MAAASACLELRFRPERKSLMERAAYLLHEPVSEFARTAAEEKADRIIHEYEATTTVPAGVFDDLFDALDARARLIAALTPGRDPRRRVGHPRLTDDLSL